MINLTFLLLISIIFLFKVILTELVEIDLKPKKTIITDQNQIGTNYEFLTLNICLGPKPQCFDAVYDTGSFFVWIPNKNCTEGCDNKVNRYNPDISENFKYIEKSKTIPYSLNARLEVDLVSDFFSFSQEMTIINRRFINWYLVNSMPNSIKNDGVVGFGRINPNSMASIIERMDLIYYNKKVFSHKYIDQNSAKLYIGDLHSDFKTTDNKKFPYCDCLNFRSAKNDIINSLWTCKMSYFFIGDPKNFDKLETKSQVNEPVVMDTGFGNIISPSTNKDIIIKYLFSDSQNPCGSIYFKKNSDTNHEILFCSNINMGKVSDFYLVLNGYALHIDKNNLFEKVNDNLYAFNIYFNDSYDYWILGLNFMKNYHLLFDFDNHYVGFSGPYYDLTSFTTDNDFSIQNYMVYIIVFAAIIVDIFAIIGIWFVYKKNKRIDPTKGNYPFVTTCNPYSVQDSQSNIIS
jgi:hypothetical protein